MCGGATLERALLNPGRADAQNRVQMARTLAVFGSKHATHTLSGRLNRWHIQKQANVARVAAARSRPKGAQIWQSPSKPLL